MCEHNKVAVSTGRLADVFDEATLDVDKRLAPLMGELWARGIFALDHSCEQRWPGLACLYFAGTLEVEDFLEVARRGYKVEVETGVVGDDDDEEDEEDAATSEDSPRVYVDLYVILPMKDLAGLARLFAGQPMPPDPEPKASRRWGRGTTEMGRGAGCG